MIISGIRNVAWGNKDPIKCFNSIKHGFVGVKNDPQFNADRRVQYCAAYQNLNKMNNKKDWPAPSIKGRLVSLDVYYLDSNSFLTVYEFQAQ